MVLGASPVQAIKPGLGSVGDFLAPPSKVSDVAEAAIAHVLESKV